MDDVAFGFVYDFGAREEWVAERGRGAFLDGEPLTGPGPKDRIEILSLEGTTTEAIALAVPGLLGVADRVRVMGSLALSLCHLAAGRVDAVCCLKPARSIDIAAAQLLVRERGLAIELFEDRRSVAPHSTSGSGRASWRRRRSAVRRAGGGLAAPDRPDVRLRLTDVLCSAVPMKRKPFETGITVRTLLIAVLILGLAAAVVSILDALLLVFLGIFLALVFEIPVRAFMRKTGRGTRALRHDRRPRLGSGRDHSGADPPRPARGLRARLPEGPA